MFTKHKRYFNKMDCYEKVPCRMKQFDELFELFGHRHDPMPHSIFISGSMATGKTLCVETVLRHLIYTTVTIDCIECYTPKAIYERILLDLDFEDDGVKCDSILDLLNALKRLEPESFASLKPYPPIILVFDRAERLRNMDPTVLPALLSLREHCKLNICTIFITHLTYENFYMKIGAREPIKLYFPNYTKDELFTIISLQQKSFIEYVLRYYRVGEYMKIVLEKPELFTNFLNAFLSVFYRPCRDLIELQHMARENFVKYCKPIVRNEIASTDLPKLWRHISPILKTSLELIYLRISEPKPLKSRGRDDSSDIQRNSLQKTLKDELTSTKTFAQSFELPYYAKYLLIAAYLASYNPPKEDKRLFMKNHGKQRKKLQRIRAKTKISEKLNTQLGPKVFTLDRLLAIFYAILEEKIGLTSNLLAQIATLVELKLIAGTKEIDLDAAKYKCIVSYDFISAVAQTVGFNVRKYLYDFM